jgi:hypothetical protein
MSKLAPLNPEPAPKTHDSLRCPREKQDSGNDKSAMHTETEGIDPESNRDISKHNVSVELAELQRSTTLSAAIFANIDTL